MTNGPPTRAWLDRWLRRHTPTSDRIFRTTRKTLREYKAQGLLPPGVNTDMTVGYQDALDDLVVDTIIDAAGNSGDKGADLFEQLRKAITVVQGEGFNPTLAAISPEDAETLDLSRSGGSAPGDGPFILSPAPRSQSASPLWDLRLRVVKGLASPIVMDPTALRLYVDPVKFDADPFTGFSTNQTRYRYEGPAALIVRQPAGVFLIEAGS